VRRIFHAALAAAIGLGLAVLPASAQTTASAQADTPPLWCTSQSAVTILGTSADTGYGTAGYPSGAQTFNRTEYGWTTKFADNLKAQWGTVTTNRAHNGALAADFLPGGRWPDTTGAIAEMATTQPDLVLIDLGGNDYWAQRDPATFQAQLGQIVDSIRAVRPGVTILMGIYPEFKWAPNVDGGSTLVHPWSEYAGAIYQTAVAKGAALVDGRQYIPPATASPQTSPSMWLLESDGNGGTNLIHLNEAGNAAELGWWWSWVASIASTC
jgi:acyl-CoA thioesterase-1